MVFPLYGECLFDVIRKYRFNGLDTKIVKKICLSILNALEHIHEVNLINTDIKPENMLVRQPSKIVRNIIKNYKIPNISEGVKLINRHIKTMSKSQKKRYKKIRKKEKESLVDCSSEEEEEYISRVSDVILSDFGNSCINANEFTYGVGTRYYKPPEDILTDDFDTSADIWSFGCCIYEILTGELLFNPQIFYKGDRRELNDDHLASMIEITGGDVLIYKDGSLYDEHCREDGSLRFIDHVKNVSLYKKLLYVTDLSKEQCKEWSDFLLYILEFNCKKRPSASQILEKYKVWLNNL